MYSKSIGYGVDVFLNNGTLGLSETLYRDDILCDDINRKMTIHCEM